MKKSNLHLPTSYLERQKAAQQIEMREATNAIYSGIDQAKQIELEKKIRQQFIVAFWRGCLNEMGKEDPEFIVELEKAVLNLKHKTDAEAANAIRGWIKSFIKQANG